MALILLKIWPWLIGMVPSLDPIMYHQYYSDCFRWQNLLTQNLLWTRLPPKTNGSVLHHKNKYSKCEPKQWKSWQLEPVEAMEVRNKHWNHSSCFEERNAGKQKQEATCWGSNLLIICTNNNILFYTWNLKKEHSSAFIIIYRLLLTLVLLLFHFDFLCFLCFHLLKSFFQLLCRVVMVCL